MRHFRKIDSGIAVKPVLAQLEAHPELWDQHTARTRMPQSPHDETSDIWVRFRDPAELFDAASYGEPHFAVFYPAWRVLSALQPIVFHLMSTMEAVYLGGILITRIPAHAQVRAHDDRGSWHAEYLNTKIYTVLQANPKCVNWCGDECVVMQPGEAWQFENLIKHGVINDGDDERIALIVTMRSES